MLSRGGAGHSEPMPARAIPLKVFLADDSPLICDRIAAMLASAGMTVVGRGDTPQACFDGILASHPDVVVLDIQLDGGSGLEVLKTVRLAAPEVAFVVFSNHSAPAYRKRYLGEGARGFVDKSTEFDQLAFAIERAACPAAASI